MPELATLKIYYLIHTMTYFPNFMNLPKFLIKEFRSNIMLIDSKHYNNNKRDNFKNKSEVDNLIIIITNKKIYHL